MKVLLISRKYPPSVGGMELFAHDLVKSLSAKVELTLIKWGGANKYLPIVYPYLFLIGFIKLLTQKIDVIHIQDGVMSLAGYVLAGIFRKPYIVVIHGLDITYDNFIYNSLFIPAIKKADKVICISQAAKESAIKRGVNESKIQVITLAVEDKGEPQDMRTQLLERYGLPQDSKILTTVGRLVKRKGVVWFVAYVMPKLVAKYPQTRYLVVGEGKMRPEIEAAIVSKGLEDNVKLLGRIADEDAELVLKGADIFVMPNINVANDVEGFGLVSLEASLACLPVVASDTEGIKDAVVNGKNGLLVEPGQEQGFINAISGLYDASKTKSFGKQSRQYTLEHYNWSKIGDEYVGIYSQLKQI